MPYWLHFHYWIALRLLTVGFHEVRKCSSLFKRPLQPDICLFCRWAMPSSVFSHVRGYTLSNWIVRSLLLQGFKPTNTAIACSWWGRSHKNVRRHFVVDSTSGISWVFFHRGLPNRQCKQDRIHCLGCILPVHTLVGKKKLAVRFFLTVSRRGFSNLTQFMGAHPWHVWSNRFVLVRCGRCCPAISCSIHWGHVMHVCRLGRHRSV